MTRKAIVFVFFTVTYPALGHTSEDDAAIEAYLPSVIEVHGFGNWSFGVTDRNHYLGAKPNGRFDAVDFALAASAALANDVFVASSMSVGINPQEARESVEVELDYAFGSWQPRGWLGLRVGQVKQPFGHYNEFRDVGTLRPFIILPQGLYGGTGLVAEAYKGVGLFGVTASDDWELSYDLYGGELHLEEASALEDDKGDEEEEAVHIKYTVGLRLILQTPFDGLRFGVSGYTGEAREDGRRSVLAAHIEYAGDAFAIRGEYAHLFVDLPVDTFYVESSYRLSHHLEIAARLDFFMGELEDERLGAVESMVYHHDISAGVNYHFNHHFIIKLSYHHIIGNRFAFPANPQRLARQIASNTVVKHTNALMFGASFSF